MLSFFEGISLSDIILYLVSGFSFIQTFIYIHNKNGNKNYQHRFIQYIIVGYILTNIYYAIPISINEYIDVIVFIVVILILSYCIAQFTLWDKFIDICKKLKINRTINQNIWLDIQSENKNGLWVYLTCEDRFIVGQLYLVENDERFPLITLKNYEKYDLEDNLIEDDSEDDSKNGNKLILIDTSKCSNIEFVYDKDCPLDK